MRQGTAPAFPAWHGYALLGAVFLLSFANALEYSARVANPVITDDAWYFLDVFVAKDLDGDLDWSDFFIKRDSADHAQPLHRLLLWILTHALQLDFWFEGLIGVAMLAVCVVILLWIARKGEPMRLGDAAIAALIPLMLFSLNAQEVYFWPLVGLFYLVLPFALVVFIGSARSWPPAALALATAAMMVAMDGAGLLAALAAASALLLAAGRGRTGRRALGQAAAIVATGFGYKLAYYALMPPVPPAAVESFGGTLSALRAGCGEAWKWFVIPAAASIAHWDHFARWFGEAAPDVVLIVGTSVLVLHFGFWWSVLRERDLDARSVAAVALMLFAYAMVAGIVLGRMPRFGVDYLWQHRYITGYQLATVALILRWLALRARAEQAAPSGIGRQLTGPAVVLGGAILLQVQLSAIADQQAPYIRAYQADMAATLHCLAAHPEARDVRCQPNHQVCSWSPQTRARLVGVLATHRLNVFNETVQRRHRMAPEPARLGVCLLPANGSAAHAQR